MKRLQKTWDCVLLFEEQEANIFYLFQWNPFRPDETNCLRRSRLLFDGFKSLGGNFPRPESIERIITCCSYVDNDDDDDDNDDNAAAAAADDDDYDGFSSCKIISSSPLSS